MIVAGEASGDIYGAEVARETGKLMPEAEFFGIGGARMREAGVTTLVDSADMAVVGLVEVLKHFDVISSAFFKLKKILLESPPDLLILIDYPGFNMRLAKVPARQASRCFTTSAPRYGPGARGGLRKSPPGRSYGRLFCLLKKNFTKRLMCRSLSSAIPWLTLST